VFLFLWNFGGWLCRSFAEPKLSNPLVMVSSKRGMEFLSRKWKIRRRCKRTGPLRYTEASNDFELSLNKWEGKTKIDGFYLRENVRPALRIA
jgi:hypothetical protein